MLQPTTSSPAFPLPDKRRMSQTDENLPPKDPAVNRPGTVMTGKDPIPALKKRVKGSPAKENANADQKHPELSN